VQERHDTTQVRAPYIDRDVAADLAYLKIAWGKQSVSDVIRDLIDQHKESLSKLSKLSKQTV
jgi:predicted CopG family antitoxin